MNVTINQTVENIRIITNESGSWVSWYAINFYAHNTSYNFNNAIDDEQNQYYPALDCGNSVITSSDPNLQSNLCDIFYNQGWNSSWSVSQWINFKFLVHQYVTSLQFYNSSATNCNYSIEVSTNYGLSSDIFSISDYEGELEINQIVSNLNLTINQSDCVVSWNNLILNYLDLDSVVS